MQGQDALRREAPAAARAAGAPRALAASPAIAALYVHIPYCLTRCPYCDFNTYAARTWPEAEYADALERELAHHARREPFASATFASVFFGGGTPSLFAPRTIGRLLDAFAAIARIDAGAEITLEANPGTVNEERLRGFREAGVNRLSFGVQTFQAELLRALGRRHSVDDSRNALAAARRVGFDNVSLDLIYAVPGQSLEACEADVAEAIAVAPEHVSAYNLTYEKGTAMHRDRAAGRLLPAPEELEVAMFEAVRARLGAAGYEHYEISNYARRGRTARHNQAYWRALPYVGLGAGAHSYAPGRTDDPESTIFGTRWENERDPARYRDAVLAGGSAITERETLNRRQAMGEACWLALRQSEGLDETAFETRFGEPLRAAFPHVDALVAEGLLEWHGPRLTLTAPGLLLADTIFASFL